MATFTEAFNRLLKALERKQPDVFLTIVNDEKSGLILTLDRLSLLTFFRGYNYEGGEMLVDYVNDLASHIEQS